MAPGLIRFRSLGAPTLSNDSSLVLREPPKKLCNSAGLPVAARFFAMDGEEYYGANLGRVGVVDLALLSFCGKRCIGILTINDIKAKVPTAVESCGAAYSDGQVFSLRR